MCWNERKLLACNPSAPGDGREFCGRVIASCLGDGAWARPLTEDAMLIASELVSNSVTAGCTTLWLSVTIHHDRTHLSVFDDAPGLPQIVRAGPDAVSGRGLAITAAVSQDWGVDVVPTGKQTWADLTMPPHRDASDAQVRCLEPLTDAVPC